MPDTSAFKMHETLSTNARAHLSLAVQHDENLSTSQALACYTKATNLLQSYIQCFAPSSPAFSNLTPPERAIVVRARETLMGLLNGAQKRRISLQQAHTQAVPRVSQKPAAPLAQGGAGKKIIEDPLRQAIESEILEESPNVKWDDIYGLEDVKRTLQEMLVLPALRPDLYAGIRRPGKGVLLFGPPGTGKTLIAKAVASNAKATFFSISAASLNSKFHGESERLMRELFRVARERRPAFIFLDEVDSMLGRRGEGEHEASRRLKTEFMAQFDGAMGGENSAEGVFVMAACNRPQDLDEAVRRRLDRRIYVGLPDCMGRKEFLRGVTSREGGVVWAISEEDIDRIAEVTEGFSGSDIKALCREAALMPLRELGERISSVLAQDVRACGMKDFEEALGIVKASSNRKQIAELERWNEKFGSGGRRKGAEKGVGKGGGKGKATGSGGAGGVVVKQSNVQGLRRVTRSQTAKKKGFGNLLFGGGTYNAW